RRARAASWTGPDPPCAILVAPPRSYKRLASRGQFAASPRTNYHAASAAGNLRRMRIKSMFLFCLFTAACAGSAPPPAAPSPAAPSAAAPSAAASSQPLVAAGEAKVGDRTKCIVSGHEFVVTADSPHAEYNGK